MNMCLGERADLALLPAPGLPPLSRPGRLFDVSELISVDSTIQCRHPPHNHPRTRKQCATKSALDELLYGSSYSIAISSYSGRKGNMAFGLTLCTLLGSFDPTSLSTPYCDFIHLQTYISHFISSFPQDLTLIFGTLRYNNTFIYKYYILHLRYIEFENINIYNKSLYHIYPLHLIVHITDNIYTLLGLGKYLRNSIFVCFRSFQATLYISTNSMRICCHQQMTLSHRKICRLEVL